MIEPEDIGMVAAGIVKAAFYLVLLVMLYFIAQDVGRIAVVMERMWPLAN